MHFLNVMRGAFKQNLTLKVFTKSVYTPKLTKNCVIGQGVYVYSLRKHPPRLYTQTFDIILFHL